MDNTTPHDKGDAWGITIRFTEDDDHTTAVAVLTAGQRKLQATGRARRNPIDPNLPQVGEDLATARALSRLSHELLSDAVARLEEVTHTPAGIYL